jgi:hypothetical protein
MFRIFACLMMPLYFAQSRAHELEVCTLAGCVSGVYFPLSGLPRQLPTGIYSAEAVIGGRPVECEIDIKPDRTLPAVCHSATGAPWVELSLEGEDRYIAVRGSAPRHVDVALRVDGRMLANRVVEPRQYRVSEPNGRICGPTCLGAGP